MVVNFGLPEGKNTFSPTKTPKIGRHSCLLVSAENFVSLEICLKKHVNLKVPFIYVQYLDCKQPFKFRSVGRSFARWC